MKAQQLGACLLLAISLPTMAQPATPSERNMPKQIVVIGHRGASALRPEHTLAAYAKAIEDGADFIEPDLVISKDGILIARHENEISETTNVGDHPEFALRKTTKKIDGRSITGWFCEDFTFAELKTLRARERLPRLRPANVTFNDRFALVSFDEIIEFVAQSAKAQNRVVGLYPEIKHSTYFRGLNLSMEDRVLTAIRKHKYSAKTTPIYIQSFEVSNLQYLRKQIGEDLSNVKLLQLLGDKNGAPYDWTATHTAGNYSQMMQAKGLAEVAKYADGIGPNKLSVIPRNLAGTLEQPTSLVADAHAQGLLVHPYTFRPENYFLPGDAKLGEAAAERDDAAAIAEIRAYLDTGINGFFTDDSRIGREAIGQ